MFTVYRHPRRESEAVVVMHFDGALLTPRPEGKRRLRVLALTLRIQVLPEISTFRVLMMYMAEWPCSRVGSSRPFELLPRMARPSVAATKMPQLSAPLMMLFSRTMSRWTPGSGGYLKPAR